MVNLKFAKLRPNAIIPSKREEDAGYDIYPCLESDNPIEIKPHETVLIPTGIASVIPEGYYMQIEERGSTGSKGIKKSAGVIDSGFRGEWFVAITNSTNKIICIGNSPAKYLYAVQNDNYIVYPSTKAIAQAILHEVIPAEVNEITHEELMSYKSERGEGSLGSSNK